MLIWINSLENMNQGILFLIMNSEKISIDSLMGKIYQMRLTFLNRTEHYNRVDKINMNDTKIVSPEKKGKDHFSLASEIA